MSGHTELQPALPSSPSDESAALLRRIVNAVEKDTRKEWAETACAVLLALATTASAWCAYQSTLWSGVQTFRLAAANRAGRSASEQILLATQGRAFDATMFLQYIEARQAGNKELEAFLEKRFRPELKIGMKAWLKTDPFNNAEAPAAPFRMTEYVQPELKLATRHQEQSLENQEAAEKANWYSDTYVLLTVLFTAVLFFGGISGTFGSRRLRFAALMIALTLFVSTSVILGTMPICQE